jgi:hypothetical protein
VIPPVDMPRAGLLASRAADALAGLAQALEAVRAAGPAASAAVLVLGLGALTLAWRAERVLAGLGGAGAGALAAWAFRGALALHLGMSPVTAALVLSPVCAGLSAALPRFFPFAAAALPGAVLGLGAPIAGRPWMGAMAVGLATGLVAAAFARSAGIAFASLAGGVLSVLGLLGLAGDHPVAAAVASRPLVVLGLALVLGTAGAAFQLGRRKAPPVLQASPPPPDRRLD